MTSKTASVVDELLRRNRKFADQHDVAGLTMMPTARTIILGCVDPRVDPAAVLGVELGEAVVIRNIGAGSRPPRLERSRCSQRSHAAAERNPEPAGNWASSTTPTAASPGCSTTPTRSPPSSAPVPTHSTRDSITDPRVSLTVDFARLRANPVLPPGLIISGLLYHTDTGRLETVVAPFRAQRAAIGAPDSRIVTTPVTKPCSRSAWSSTRVR